MILHYTEVDFPHALEILTKGSVSSHYLISDKPATIYQLVDESQRAYHAGMSTWGNDAQLNVSSIGIELVNPGYQDTPQGRVFFAYPPEQITLLIDLLKQIVARHHIEPDHILATMKSRPNASPIPVRCFRGSAWRKPV